MTFCMVSFILCRVPSVLGSQVAEFLGTGKLTLAKLLTAQGMIADYMESTWYKPYLDYLRADEEQDKKPSSMVVQEAIEHRRSFHCKERTVSWDAALTLMGVALTLMGVALTCDGCGPVM